MRTYGSLALEPSKQRWVIKGLEPHVAIRFKQMFPRVPISSAGPFYLSDNPDIAADIQWFISRYPLIGDTRDMEYLNLRAQSFYTNQAEAGRILLPDWKPTRRTGLRKGQKFHQYQRIFLDYLEKTGSLLLVDDIGLGKTYEGLGVGLIPGSLPMVAVVEPHLSKQWVEKAEAFINLRIHAVSKTTPYDLPPADIYVFRYTQLSGWVDVLASGYFQSIVFDEIQQLRHGDASAKGQAAAGICAAIPRVVGLTATPIYNYGIECFNIVELIRKGILGTRQDFLREWCTADYGGKGIVKDPDALGTYLREQHVMLRRTKRDVGQEVKEQPPHLEWVEPSEKDVSDSIALAESLAVTTLTAGFAEAGMAARDFDMRLRQLTGIAKAKSVAAYARMFVETGTPIILFGWHREVYRIWLKELEDLNPLMYTGSETTAQKERIKQAYINGESDILIISLRSGAGVDGLQYRCSTIIYGELDWSPKIHQQCTGRVDRDGQLDPVFVFYAVTQFGSDPTIIDMHGLKEDQGRGVTDPGTQKEHYQSDGARVRRLAEDWLRSRGKTPPKRTRYELPVREEEQLALI
jgi:hypothetical protein